MAKGDKFYFENFVASAALAKKAATYLVTCLENYDPEKLDQMLQQMHEIEHSADIKKHEMSDALAKAFVTPLDREDLDLLSHRLDDVSDQMEDAMQKFYIYNIQAINPSAIVFAKQVVRACELLCKLMEEFENFKRSKTIQGLIVELNDVEEECDKLYLTSVRELTIHSQDALQTIFWHKIFDCLEACVDACEHVSESVRTVIMKNT